jgi:ribosomal protein L11 methyltransferase
LQKIIFLEILIPLMAELGCSGFMETDTSLLCYVGKKDWTSDKADRFTHFLKNHFPTEQSKGLFSVREIPEENWNKKWEETILPVEAGDRFVVVPTWSDYDNKSGRIILQIDPKMSFGTGHHETTRLTLRLLEHYLTPGNKILDVGTGSGILAIAAIKIGALHATGIDIDSWSIGNAMENVALNHVEDVVDISLGEPADIKNNKFDLITSNLTLNANKGLLREYSRLLTNGGILLLSGFLRTDVPEMEKHLMEIRFGIGNVIAENEWSAIGAVKTG